MNFYFMSNKLDKIIKCYDKKEINDNFYLKD